jgi:hypothetical protein
METSGHLAALQAAAADLPAELRPLPGQLEIRPPAGTVGPHKGATRHGWHSGDAVQIPTSLTCNQCPLYHVKRKDPRHPLSCPEGRKNSICPILTRLQLGWAEGLIDEVQQATDSPPTPSDNARIEQVVRHRSRIFQIENYLKVAGLIDLRSGEVRNVADRLTTTENALTRVLGEYRQAISERREQQPHRGPRLQDYLREIQEANAGHDVEIGAVADRIADATVQDEPHDEPEDAAADDTDEADTDGDDDEIDVEGDAP